MFNLARLLLYARLILCIIILHSPYFCCYCTRSSSLTVSRLPITIHSCFIWHCCYYSHGSFIMTIILFLPYFLLLLHPRLFSYCLLWDYQYWFVFHLVLWYCTRSSFITIILLSSCFLLLLFVQYILFIYMSPVRLAFFAWWTTSGQQMHTEQQSDPRLFYYLTSFSLVSLAIELVVSFRGVILGWGLYLLLLFARNNSELLASYKFLELPRFRPFNSSLIPIFFTLL